MSRREPDSDPAAELGLIAYQLRGEFTLLEMVVESILKPSTHVPIPKATIGQFLHVDDVDLVALRYVMSRIEDTAWELDRAAERSDAA